MFNKILLATDGSDHSLKASDIALQLAQKHDSKVEIIYVVQKISIMDMDVLKEAGKNIEKIQDGMKKKGKEIIVLTAKKFDELNLPYESKVVIGEDVAEVICKEAETEGADVIILGTRGQTGLSRFLLGSVSSKVVNHAPCSVSVIR